MANIQGGSFERWDTNSTLSRHPRSKINRIVVECPAASAGGTTTLREGGLTGAIFYSRLVNPGEVEVIDAEGQWFDTLALSALGTGVIVTVHYA